MCMHSKVNASDCQEATHYAAAKGKCLDGCCDALLRIARFRWYFVLQSHDSELQGGENWPRLDQSNRAVAGMRELGFSPF
jgi:hypothetical protein